MRGLSWDRIRKVFESIKYLRFDIDADPEQVEGQVNWNEQDHCLEYTSGLGSVVQIGQELWGIGVNKTGGEALDGRVVYASGIQGNRLAYNYADAREAVKAGFVGVVTAPTDDNQEGPVTTFGFVRDFDTTAWPAGTKLYIAADDTGVMTGIPPARYNFRVWVATVVNQHETQGIIFVSPRIDFANGITFSSLDVIGLLSINSLTANRPVFINTSKELVSGVHITPTTQTVTTGTLSSGTVDDVQVWGDSNSVNISEVTGAPGFDVRYTFESVAEFLSLGASAYYTGAVSGHYAEYQIYDDTNNTWRTLWSFRDGDSFNYRFSDFPGQGNMSDYINSSEQVITRFYHPTSGNAAHDLFVGYVALVGYST